MRTAGCPVEVSKDSGSHASEEEPQEQTAAYMCFSVPRSPELPCPAEEEPVPWAQGCACAWPRTQRASRAKGVLWATPA